MTRAENILEFFWGARSRIRSIKEPDKTEKRYDGEIKVNTHGTPVNGSSNQGTIRITYDNLVKAFGVPKKGREVNHKIGVEWDLDFKVGKKKISVNIYDWKQNKEYVKSIRGEEEGEEGLDPQDITLWEVGGKYPESLHIVTAYFRQSGVEYKKISYL